MFGSFFMSQSGWRKSEAPKSTLCFDYVQSDTLPAGVMPVRHISGGELSANLANQHAILCYISSAQYLTILVS